MMLDIIIYLAAVITATSATGSDVRDKLFQFANDGLGVQDFQSYIDSEVTFRFTPLDGPRMAEELSKSMATKLQVRIDALEQMVEDITETYDSVANTSGNPFKSCCDITLNQESSILNTNINAESLCTTGQGTTQGAKEYLPYSINDKVKAQYETALGIKYAYYGSEEGVMFNYPAIRTCDVEYDPRFRPWYVEAATPNPKDVVIVLDRSGSMSETYNSRSLISIAVDAAKTVISTLNPNDRVGVVAFNEYAVTPGYYQPDNCYSSELAVATAQNKAYFNSYLATLTAGGGTEYTGAFQRAFTFFINTPKSATYDTREREKVILFLSDGKPHESNSTILNRIASLNAELENTVIILTYGIGLADTGILIQIAQHTTPGSFTLVEDVTNLRSSMASYYNRFKETDRAHVSFTVPFLDAFGSGLTEAMCLPVNHNDTLKGVACLELSVDDMLSDITYFRQGQNSYAFIIDKNARLLTHPSLPLPEDVTNEPYFLYVDAVETFDGVKDMLSSMLRRQNGSISVTATQIVSRGDVQLEGVEIKQQQKTYSWSNVEGTDFSLCLVIPEGDYISEVMWNNSLPGFLYHRLDLTIQALKLCRLFTRIVTKDLTAVFLAARAFQDPFKHLHAEETVNDVLRYEAYLSLNDKYNPGLREGIQETVAMTSKFEDILRSSSQYEVNCVWRYVGMENGVHRIYPASEIPKNYDPVRRTWYLRAKAHGGKVVVSVPYEDAFGAGTVVTVSQVVYEGQWGDSDRHVTGVMGMDFTVPYFYYLVTEDVEDCQTHSCFVMDDSGFIIAHKDWFTGQQKSTQITDVHITVYETGVAETLIENGTLQSGACVNIENLQNQYFWRVNMSSGSYNHENFDLHQVPDTNVFLVIVKNPFKGCSCRYQSGYYPLQCSTYNEYSCYFPCYSPSSVYQHCENQFDFSGGHSIQCTPPSPVVYFTQLKEQESFGEEIQTASECYNYNCMDRTERSNPSECNSVVSCGWCLYDYSGNQLDNPYCSTQSECPLEQRLSQDEIFCTYVPPSYVETVTESVGGFAGWKIFLICLGLILFFAISAALVVVIKRKM